MSENIHPFPEIPVGLKRAAVLCLLESEEGVLLLERNKEPHKGKYIPIGGKIEPFEDPLSAVIRETFEEVGIKLKKDDVRYAGVLAETSPVKFNFINFIYRAHVDFFEPPLCDEGRLQWVAREDMEKLPAPETDRFIYQFAKSGRIFMLNAIYDEKLNLISLVEEIQNEVIL
jgi:8-oxo-dGTP diphosphatase